jgi:hypothetical protein
LLSKNAELIQSSAIEMFMDNNEKRALDKERKNTSSFLQGVASLNENLT